VLKKGGKQRPTPLDRAEREQGKGGPVARRCMGEGKGGGLVRRTEEEGGPVPGSGVAPTEAVTVGRTGEDKGGWVRCGVCPWAVPGRKGSRPREKEKKWAHP
jgi:hypothetical protein